MSLAAPRMPSDEGTCRTHDIRCSCCQKAINSLRPTFPGGTRQEQDGDDSTSCSQAHLMARLSGKLWKWVRSSNVGAGGWNTMQPAENYCFRQYRGRTVLTGITGSRLRPHAGRAGPARPVCSRQDPTAPVCRRSRVPDITERPEC